LNIRALAFDEVFAYELLLFWSYFF